MEQPHWLEELTEGEEIFGFYSDEGGLTGQGRLFRVKTQEWRPDLSPSRFGTDFIDDALIDTVRAINEGLACAERKLVLILEVTKNGHPIFFKDDKRMAEAGEEYEALRQAFNAGEDPEEIYIRFVVARRT